MFANFYLKKCGIFKRKNMTEKRIVFEANLTAVSIKGRGSVQRSSYKNLELTECRLRGEQVRRNNFKKNFIPAPP